MQILQKIFIDFGMHTIPTTIFAKRYDSESRYIEIMPLNNGQKYDLESGVTAALQILKPDGKVVITACTIANGVITAELSKQALAVDGIAVAEIALYKNTAVLSSQTFYIEVRDSAYIAGAYESSNEYNALVEALGKVNASLGSVEEAVIKAGNATAAANTAASGAGAAKNAANNAASEANTAATGAEKVNISAEQTATGADITVTNRAGTATTVHIDTLNAISTWADIRNAVRMGLGEKLFPVGYEFTTVDTDTGVTLVWAVRGHDHHTPANSHLTHSMTIEMKNVYSNANGSYKAVQFDAQEALYYAADGLAAGTYNFSLLAGYDAAYGGGKTFSFTLTHPVPAGGVIMFPWAWQTQSALAKISIYASNTATTAIETVSVVEGANGTSLGTADGTSENMNHTHRLRYGSNNYAQSAVRQWLNSSAAAGAVWTPTNKFDRPPVWAATYNGFMHGLPADFLAVVEPAIIPCRTNSVFECASLDGTEFTTNQTYNLKDKFFLLSRPEIYGTWDSATYKDGVLLDYYDGLTTAEYKKYDNGGAVRSAWLRSPHPSYANYARIVNTAGSLYYDGASHSYGVAPACIIA